MTPANDSVPQTDWSPVRDVVRLVERHRKLLVLEYSPAGWKTAQMVEQRIHAISDRLLSRSTNYPSLRWLLDHRDAVPVLDLTKEPALEAAARAFDYLESIDCPDYPRRAVCLTAPQPGRSASA